jgi:hypothetical protein
MTVDACREGGGSELVNSHSAALPTQEEEAMAMTSRTVPGLQPSFSQLLLPTQERAEKRVRVRRVLSLVVKMVFGTRWKSWVHTISLVCLNS